MSIIRGVAKPCRRASGGRLGKKKRLVYIMNWRLKRGLMEFFINICFLCFFQKGNEECLTNRFGLGVFGSV